MFRRPTSSIITPTIARRISPLLAGALLVVAAGCTAAPPSVTGPPPTTGTAQPSTGLYVEPDAPAARQATQWESEGRADDAAKMRRIAAEPIAHCAHWLTKPTGHIGDDVADYVGKAKAVGARPLLVAYHIPNRDCGSFSGGGADDPDDYRAWIREVAENLGDSRAMIVVEPDAVPHELGECSDEEGERSGLLADAVEVLKGAGATVYLDAGNPGFIPDVGALAGALKNSGVGKADGFSLNVANFYPTEANLDYGRKISAALGGTHFVVDTGRNGNGRSEGQEVDGAPSWCNPPGRAVDQAHRRVGRLLPVGRARRRAVVAGVRARARRARQELADGTGDRTGADACATHAFGRREGMRIRGRVGPGPAEARERRVRAPCAPSWRDGTHRVDSAHTFCHVCRHHTVCAVHFGPRPLPRPRHGTLWRTCNVAEQPQGSIWRRRSRPVPRGGRAPRVAARVCAVR